MEPRRMALITEDLTEPIDEGVKRFAFELGRAMSALGDLERISVLRHRPAGHLVRETTSDRLFRSGELPRLLAQGRYSEVYYVPTASATPAGLMRAASLRRHLPAARVGVVALLPRDYPLWFRPLRPFFRPHRLYVFSPGTADRMRRLGYRVTLIPAGVDAQRFSPVDAVRKAELRSELGLPGDRRILLHVGHLSANRSPETLIRAARETAFTPLVVVSTSTPERAEIAARLESAGCVVWRRYFEGVEDLYRLSDAYLFPVWHPDGCIEFPLSVLEALATGTPVVARRFGGLPHFLPEGEGLQYFDGDEDALRILKAMDMSGVSPRDRARPFTWGRVAEEIVHSLRSEDIPKEPR